MVRSARECRRALGFPPQPRHQHLHRLTRLASLGADNPIRNAKVDGARFKGADQGARGELFLRQALFATESLVVTGPALYLAQTDTCFDSSGRLTDEAARSALRQILQALAQIMRTRA
jgi:hypothetical protein